jgi:glycosyltransferase involved in cell wall biosynthesis
VTPARLRIVYLADIRFPIERANGIQTMETCHALGTRGHRVELVVRPDTHVPARDPFTYYNLGPLDHLTIQTAPVAGPAVARRIGYLSFAIGRVAGPGRADVVFTRDLGVASLLLRLPRSLRPPVVYESHGYAPDVAAALPQLIATATAPGERKLRRLADREAHVWRAADGYVTITSSLAEDLVRRHGSRPRLSVVPDGTRLGNGGSSVEVRRPSMAAQGSAAEVRRPVVAYAGHLYAWKGVDVLLEALALVPDVDGLIVGGHAAEPDLERVRGVARRLNISDRVTFTGLVAPGRVAELLRSAAILVLPNPASAISDRFTSPLKLFEYMAAGGAIVASDLPSIREVLRDGVNALLVRAGDPAAIAAAIRRLAAEAPLAARLGAAAADASRQYSWERRAERLEDLFKEVVAVRS